jgi:hypothetical protein
MKNNIKNIIILAFFCVNFLEIKGLERGDFLME